MYQNFYTQKIKSIFFHILHKNTYSKKHPHRIEPFKTQNRYTQSEAAGQLSRLSCVTLPLEQSKPVKHRTQHPLPKKARTAEKASRTSHYPADKKTYSRIRVSAMNANQFSPLGAFRFFDFHNNRRMLGSFCVKICMDFEYRDASGVFGVEKLDLGRVSTIFVQYRFGFRVRDFVGCCVLIEDVLFLIDLKCV